MTLSNHTNNSLFLPRELFAPPPTSAIDPDDDPFHMPFDVQRAPGRVDLYLPLLAPRGPVACA